MPSPKLRVQDSVGPKKWTSSIDGLQRSFSTPCDVCREAITEGQPISYLRGGWAHKTCATNSLISADAGSAWLALASDLSRYPRSYNVAETRVIVDQLIRMAAGMVPDEYEIER